MARPLRLEFPGALYHVMSRGHEKSSIFRDRRDRRTFLAILAAVIRRERWLLHSYCLLGNHYHLLLETPLGKLSRGMHALNALYSQRFNRRHERCGHLFEGRFKSPLVENGWYGRSVVRYIALNPVEANYVRHAAEWPWSSHRALAGLVSPPEFLDLDWLRSYFDGASLRECQRQYQRFIDDAELRLTDFGDEFVVGSERYRSNVRELIGATMYRIDVPRSYRALARPPLRALFAGCRDDLERRNLMVIRAQVVWGYTQSEIARALGVHSNTISKITRAIKRQRYFVVRVK